MKSVLLTIAVLSVTTQSFAEYENGHLPGEPIGPPIEKMVIAGGERTIDHPVPPVTNMDHSGEGYESGHLPGTPIQAVLPGEKKIIDPPPVAMTAQPNDANRPPPTGPGVIHVRRERTHPALVPPVTTRLSLPGEERTIGHPVPPAKMAIERTLDLPNLFAPLANLHPDVELIQQSVFWAGAAVLTLQLVRMGAMAYTRNPQVAAFVPPITISSGEGRYKVPSNAKYTLGDARYVAAMIADLSPEAAEDYVSTLDPELVEYTLQVNQAVRTGMAEDYARYCPNPDMCT